MTTANAYVHVNTARYYRDNGQEPKGTGSWAFFMGESSQPIFFNGTYAACRKQAIAKAREIGATSVEVGS